ncbi:hypothetical protein [Butyrivibrio sp. YAB3001]|uniref:hypothetical protein n=1 Tax=Butyrivibrio sp. YAB3001 TaxID=1520812 RepID=UPI0008F67504|nr:hypothetical protein [Butyrivibrio sp. YAB3001]SFC84231.1 hypothetical protein SAMN02910398_03286 [Butyrivibrio sp. YAB3001]
MQYLFSLYAILLCTVLPLYMKSGYYNLGEAKAKCYFALSIPFFIIFLTGYVYEYVKNKRKEQCKNSEKLTTAQYFFYGTLVSCLITYMFSIDKKTAFWGYEGWRTGLFSTIMSLAFCFFFRKWKRQGKLIFYIVMIIPFLEFILSILNRFGNYPFAIEGKNPSFLATLGNIGWFSGYLSIWVPVGIGIMYIQKEFSMNFFISGGYTIAGLIALLIQGSNGAALIIMSSYLLLLWCSLSDREAIKRFLIQLLILGISMTIVDILLLFFHKKYNYENNILIGLCEKHVGLVLIAVAFFAYSLLRLFEEINVEYSEKLTKRIYSIGMISGAATAIFFLLNNFSDSFGNGRGLILRLSARVFEGFSGWQRFVGIGQDCLYVYALENEELKGLFIDAFGGSALTNSHCELFTILIERGILGAFLYLGLFISILIKLIKARKRESAAIIYALPIISYFVYNQVSFAQLTSTPYIYLIIGMAMTI